MLNFLAKILLLATSLQAIDPRAQRRVEDEDWLASRRRPKLGLANLD